MDFQEIELLPGRLNRVEDWASLRLPEEFEKGLVSVIVPTYNRAAFLAEALASVVSQTYRPVELLIVDDGSTDNTAEVVRKFFAGVPAEKGFKAFYLRQPNRGASAARNQGLLHSRGEFIQYLDSDDVLVRHKIASHAAALAGGPLDIVWSKWLVMPSEKLAETLRLADEGQNVAEKNFAATEGQIPWEPWPTLTCRRFLAGHPLWNENVSRWDDWEFALRQLPRRPRRAVVEGIGCIQREHTHGRRQDFDYNPKGVEVGLVACREAAKACECAKENNLQIRQAVADRCWETGIEALQRGTGGQAVEAFGLACQFAARPAFKLKTFAARLAAGLGGKRLGRLVFAKYCQAG